MTFQFNAASLIEALPDAPSPDTSDRYAFIDTKQVVQDMRDLGYEVAGFRRPRFRTNAGSFGLHEVDFRLPKDIAKPAAETPRVLFLNTYDGSRRAQIITGVFRLICLNGLIAGSTLQNEKFLHLGNYEEDLVEQIGSAGETAVKAFDQIERYRGQNLSKAEAMWMAKRAVELRTPEGAKFEISPSNVLLARRREDVRSDLWTTFNRIQENLLKGGIPATDENGKMRTMRGVTQIQKSNDLNRDLWDLLAETSQQI